MKKYTKSQIQEKIMTIKIENWAIVSPQDPYTAPELLRFSLKGEVYGHPRFSDGFEVTTSYIIGSDGETITTKSGSKYELGKVKDEYEKLYPNARSRLFKSLMVNYEM